MSQRIKIIKRNRNFRKNRSQAMIFGVCAGLSDYFGIDRLWFRLGFIGLTFMGFGLPILLYVAIAILAN